MERLTKQEWRAINSALSRVLADDFEDDDADLIDAMRDAQAKVWERMGGQR